MRRLLTLARRMHVDRRAILVAAVVLLVAGLVMALLNETAYSVQKQREIGVQTQILAASVAPALMFDDSASAQEYLNALGSNPDVQSAAVYGVSGNRVAIFNRNEAAPPPERAIPARTTFANGRVVAAAPVSRDSEVLGSVYLETATEPALQRISRYIGIGILIVMAALVLIVVAVAQGALREANNQLSVKARDLQAEIEQREKAEEALLQSRKMEAIGQLTGGVAHDFNNLLMVVISGLRLLDRQNDPEQRGKTMEAMRQAVERGAGLTRQLLAFSRRQTLSLQPVDVGHQIRNMRELLQRSLRADILVDFNLPTELWHARTDPAQLELAILNLAVNARDAMPKGGVLTISAENAPKEMTGAQNDTVRIKVRDTGLGIPPEILDRVFEPYFTTKQTGKGTGLGLSQVYGFVSQSGGAIVIDSVLDQGTTMTVTLPRSETLARQEPATQRPVREAERGKGQRVLIVEDEDAVATFVSEMFTQLGHQVTRVSNAAAALMALREASRFDLVFSDIIMPGGMNGIELAREIRRLHPNLPLLLTTGYSGGGTETPDFPVLRKPYQLEDLERALTDVVGGRMSAA